MVTCLLLAIIIGLVKIGRHRNNGYPLRLVPDLAASFGEIRPNHFHMGLDLRTNGSEGQPVYTVKTGFIRRVSIQSTGYGKALFVEHPDGTTTLYAHLSRFEKEIEEWATDQQYKSQCQKQELQLSPDLFSVTKGQCIGYSGNTGSSEGPHLHFEIRDTRSGKSYNPLLKELNIADEIDPVIKNLYWYDRCNSLYEGAGQLIKKSSLKLQTPFIGLGVEISDQFTKGRFKTGIYKISLYKDGELQYQFALQRISAADARYVNACIDYARAIDSGVIVQLLFTLPGNHLTAVQHFPAGGTLDLSDRLPHKVKIVATDVSGNEAEKSFTIQYDGSRLCAPVARHTRLLYPGRDSELNSSHASVRFGRNTFYDAVPFLLLEKKTTQPGAASVIATLHNTKVPVHDSFTVSLNTSLSTGHPLRKRTVMVLKGEKNTIVVKGTWIGNAMRGRFNELGSIQLLTDTFPPVILQKTTTNKQITVTCRDNLGDIASFRGEIDGHWLAFERKENTFTYLMDDHFPEGAHSLTITITDVAGNSTRSKYVTP